jgi:DNA primase
MWKGHNRMAFPPGFLDELRARVSLSALIGRGVKLLRRGREYAGLCPFHNEKTPSFYVVEDKSFFHCFGCGAHGDAIGFVMRKDNLDFIEAIEKLAGEAGLAIPRATPQERERAQQQKTLLGALEAAAAFYETCLAAPAAARARNYLARRGLDAETIRHFRLGWAPDDRHALWRSLSADFSDSLLVEAGLLRRSSTAVTGDPIDYFRNRVIFPIGDRNGRVIAFGGRVVDDGQPKYLNSPESAVFEKGRVLYGWAAARAGLSREVSFAGPGVIVTEGYMDVIALHRAGFPTAVAPLGTALTDFQLQDLWRLGPEPVLCFDGDEPGRQAAARVLLRALPLLQPGRSLRFATLPSGGDPDSVIRTGGRDAFGAVLGAARPLSDKLWEIELASRPSDTPERRADLRRRLMGRVELILDRTVQAEYRNLYSDLLYQRFDPRANGIRSRERIRRALSTVHEGPPPPARAPQPLQREMLFRILLQFPSLLVEVAEEFASLDLPEADSDRLRHKILGLEAVQPGLDAETLRQHLEQSGFAVVVDTLLSPSVDTGFVDQCPDLASARKKWTHVIRMLGGRERSVMADVGSDLESELSAETWERFQAAREQALQQSLIDSEDNV